MRCARLWCFKLRATKNWKCRRRGASFRTTDRQTKPITHVPPCWTGRSTCKKPAPWTWFIYEIFEIFVLLRNSKNSTCRLTRCCHQRPKYIILVTCKKLKFKKKLVVKKRKLLLIFFFLNYQNRVSKNTVTNI